MDTCVSTESTGSAQDWSYQTSSGVKHVQDCCEDTCPFAGLAYGSGADFSLEYDWDCNLSEYNNPTDFRYQCAKDTLSFGVTTISSSSLITTTNIVEEARISNSR
jgi:hypothetical protein